MAPLWKAPWPTSQACLFAYWLLGFLDLSGGFAHKVYMSVVNQFLADPILVRNPLRFVSMLALGLKWSAGRSYGRRRSARQEPVRVSVGLEIDETVLEAPCSV